MEMVHFFMLPAIVMKVSLITARCMVRGPTTMPMVTSSEALMSMASGMGKGFILLPMQRLSDGNIQMVRA